MLGMKNHPRNRDRHSIPPPLALAMLAVVWGIRTGSAQTVTGSDLGNSPPTFGLSVQDWGARQSSSSLGTNALPPGETARFTPFVQPQQPYHRPLEVDVTHRVTPGALGDRWKPAVFRTADMSLARQAVSGAAAGGEPTLKPRSARWFAAPAPLPRLYVSANHRFLVAADGAPFFYLADTAWELFHRLNRADAARYLEDRAQKGFTVIQAVVLAELDGLNDPNPYGQRPLIGNDPTRPNEAYFEQVDWVVAKANALGLYLGMLPTWGDKWNKKWGVGPEVFTPQNAAAYGAWLGRRYKDAGLIWILGGDRPVENDRQRTILEAMARGLRAGDAGAHLMTLHPTGGSGSGQYFPDADWLDFNMRQNGHAAELTGHYDQTRMDYDRTPVKPVLDGEPLYEDHPLSFDADRLGHSIAADVRRPLYWDLFSGACGHTYGNHAVWQMWAPGRTPINHPLMPWFEAIHQPGAAQMQFARWLLESRPYLNRVPDDSVIVTDRVPTAVPGAGRYRFVATRDAAGSYALVYAPVGRRFRVHLDKITGAQVKAWWFNPRSGQATVIGVFPNTGQREFVPPNDGEMLDWVLVLDDASKHYSPPGNRR